MSVCLPALRRFTASPGDVRQWAICGTDITISCVRPAGGWHLHGVDASEDWLAEQGLSTVTFDTRRGALEAFTACHAACPCPAEQYFNADEQLHRAGPGEHRSRDGEYRVTRRGGVWEITRDDDFIAQAVTLHLARVSIGHDRSIRRLTGRD